MSLPGGCSYRAIDVPVKGVVTLDGAPSAGIGVFFIPTDSARHAEGLLGQGFTDAEGRFVLRNAQGKETFFRGEFKVTFTLYRDKAGKPVPLSLKPSDVGGVQVLPERYTMPQQTPFTVDVSRDKADFAFRLDSK